MVPAIRYSSCFWSLSREPTKMPPEFYEAWLQHIWLCDFEQVPLPPKTQYPVSVKWG